MRQRLADYRLFWNEFRRTYHDTGAIMPSGRRLALALTRFVREADLVDSRPRRILEVGPGTGAVTQHVLSGLRPADRAILVELNERFANRLRERMNCDPAWQAAVDQVEVVQASIEDLSESNPFDVIISGLPLNNFSIELVERIVTKMMQLLAVGGTLSFFEYIAVRKAKAVVSSSDERRRLRSIGTFVDRLCAEREIRRDQVWANVPPAWVHHLQ